MENMNMNDQEYEIPIEIDTDVSQKQTDCACETKSVENTNHIASFPKKQTKTSNTVTFTQTTSFYRPCTQTSRFREECSPFNENKVCFDLNCKKHDVIKIEFNNSVNCLNKISDEVAEVDFDVDPTSIDVEFSRNCLDNTKIELDCTFDTNNNINSHDDFVPSNVVYDIENAHDEEPVIDLDEIYKELFDDREQSSEFCDNIVIQNENAFNLADLMPFETLRETLNANDDQIDLNCQYESQVDVKELDNYIKELSVDGYMKQNIPNQELGYYNSVDFEDFLTVHHINAMNQIYDTEKHLENENNSVTVDQEDLIQNSNDLNHFKKEDMFDFNTQVIKKEDSDDDGYNSSDFEFITENEAKESVIVFKKTSKFKTTERMETQTFENKDFDEKEMCYQEDRNMQKESIVIKDRDYYRQLRSQYLAEESRRMRVTHAVPQGDDYFSLFLESSRAGAGPRENKSVTFPTSMNVDRNTQWSYINSPEDIPYLEEAKSSAQKIMEMYPEENNFDKRRRSKRNL